ncbi:Stk1 family PASTA domain-containing Ser/Thr kinase [Desmospora profundinema]|uniref:non-specific serine/threonine protein kinase n=1 Tax=Desmospora profundinema TaxID=1571184 RepID=A0ABU1IRB1_9BACL|nr:Stk1 family PASTA domain-containing Ser/Thr kinase [Desmospora profundinema]MDR6227241.1 serine/threonine-protein kinase [Desmospora profundinema]
MEGRKLGGRYEVISRVGGGGMAVVYKARDVLLNRFVAIKVLNESLSNDSEFVRRFSREAQAAASLSHPNVVSVYDVGQERHTHYIVMEYIEGPTLKEYIQQYSPLTSEEIVSIASQICDALSHAHENEIVHRDIKPHNILLGYNGRAKVTDFGIARATSSSTITQAGSVMGSVHYFSPEQARGGVIGAKSDIYSLGVVMYEMVTGELPFDGDSAISIAMKHLQDPVPDPSTLNADVPQHIRDIIMRAMDKDPDRRFTSAREMKQAVDAIFHYDRLNEPQWRNGREEDDEPTKPMPAVGAGAVRASAGDDNRDKDGRHKVGEQTLANLERLRRVPADKDKTMLERTVVWLENAQANMPWWQKILFGLFTIIVILSLAIFTFDTVIGLFTADGGGTVPNVSNMSQAEAVAALEKAGLKTNTQDMPHSSDKGTVVKTEPGAGKAAEKGSTVTLFVSTGSDTMILDDYAGSDPKQVENLLKDMGIEVKVSDEEYNSDYEDGQVHKTEPANGEEVKARDTVTLYVNSADGTVVVEDYNGQWQSRLQNNESKLDYKVEYKFYHVPGVQQGIIVGSDPAPGERVKRGGKVEVWISQPGQKETIPNR